MKKIIGRRHFLKAAAGAAAVAPAAMSLPRLALAQTAKTAAAHKTPAAPTGPKVTLSVRDLGAVGDGKAGNPAIRGRIERSTRLRLPALLESNGQPLERSQVPPVSILRPGKAWLLDRWKWNR